jgi:hypothetical protein
MAGPVCCPDEEEQQSHRIGMRPMVSQRAVNEVVISLNSTLRKVLGYQTSSEVFTAHIMPRCSD